MHTPSHKLDPDGDVLLTLHNPAAPFAVWVNRTLLPPPPPHSDSQHVSAKTDDDGSLSAKKPDVRFLLSSKHLSLASDYFKRMFRSPWKESSADLSTGYHHVDAKDWDPDALLILMQILHCQNAAVPTSVDLEMLAKLAVLVDYYRCHDATTIWVKTWIPNVKDSVPSVKSCFPNKCGRNLILWILIARVFDLQDISRTVFEVACKYCPCPLPTLDLPIVSVAEKVNSIRLHTLEGIFDILDWFLASYLNGTAGCSMECSAMLLGWLTKRMDGPKILPDERECPYLGHSTASVIEAIKGFGSPRWYHNDDELEHPCKLFYGQTELGTWIALRGLDLESLINDPNRRTR
ncbi:uncharacterized protein GGS25DRAFT_474095 [Hypoxylon fragiforme]|uniref:uncharacterized protein n=1 Tax=Hypoxylon fragiforme TaxID=63214 RepID=UPI0020C6F15E|nr:uncharacterized protein GGS25DRAFT_474095 [Hypoxylon fragiforme]KAI2612176.1 hypothetical protein GGS25DRAFT_474095 [Hypoxylon fragiforme]